jgi:hypothetical protein
MILELINLVLESLILDIIRISDNRTYNLSIRIYDIGTYKLIIRISDIGYY